MQLPASLTAREFEHLLARETDRVELREGISRQRLQDTLVALSNTEGGVVLIGVRDDGSIRGRRRDPSLDDKIHDVAMAAKDLGRYVISTVDVAGTEIVAVQVRRREEGFAQTSSGRVLVRRGSRSVALFGAELVRFINQRALRRFESTETELELKDAEPILLNEVCGAIGLEQGDKALVDRLQERGLVGNSRQLTIAGALLLTDPATSLDQHKAIIEVRRYPEEGFDYDRREEFGGPLHHQIATATKFILDELGHDLVVTGVYRHELPKVPEVVVREAIANAVAHRAYEDHRAAIVVEMRPDQVVVTSPGGLPEPVTVENLRQAQAARNQSVIDTLRRFRLAEDAGRGIDVMQDSMADALLDPPVFDDEGHAVRVTLPLRGPIAPEEKVWVLELERLGTTFSQDRLLLVHAARGERLTNARAREILGVDRLEARQALHRLRDAGLIKQIGSRGGASYSLVEDIAPPAAFRMDEGGLENLVVQEAARAPLSNSRVREVTGLSRREALALLRRLVSQGRLQQRGAKRGTRYTPPREA